MDQGPFSGATACPYFGLCVTLLMEASQDGSLTCTLTCLHAVNLRVTSGTTSAFSTNTGAHCTSMYTADSPSRHLSCKQQRAGGSGLLIWAVVRFDLVLAHLTSECAIHLATPASLLKPMFGSNSYF